MSASDSRHRTAISQKSAENGAGARSAIHCPEIFNVDKHWISLGSAANSVVEKLVAHRAGATNNPHDAAIKPACARDRGWP